MAGFQGFEGFDFERSADVKAEFQEGLQRALSSGNPDMMGAANMQQIAFTLAGGTPAFREAKKKEAVLRKAAAEANKEAGEDEVENEMLFYENAREAAIEAGLPDIAMTATKTLSSLRIMQEERARLQATEEDRVITADQTQRINELTLTEAEQTIDIKSQRMIIDNETGRAVDSYDMRNTDEIVAAEEQVTGSNGGLSTISMQDYTDQRQADRLARLRLRATIRGAGSKNPSHLVSFYGKQADSALTFSTSIDQLADIVLEDPNVLTIGNQAQAKVADLAVQGRSLAAATGAMEENNFLINSNTELAAITDKRIKGAVVDIAFAIASSREGGKLTDRDIQAAVETIGVEGNPNPAALAAVMVDVVQRKRRAWTDDKLIALTLQDDPEIVKSQQMIHDRLLATENKLVAWRDSFRTEETSPTTVPVVTPQTELDRAVLFDPDP